MHLPPSPAVVSQRGIGRAAEERVHVTVVIPTYNRGHVVARAAASALAQTHDDLDVLVVDDGSTDDTADRLKTIGDGRLHYVLRPHAGVSATRNAGVKLATGEFISFLDSDDEWKPHKLQCELAFFKQHPELDAVFTDLEKYDGDVFVPSFMRASPLFSRRLTDVRHRDGIVVPSREMYLYLLQEVFVKPSALTMRLEAFRCAGGFDERWSSSEDWEFLLRFAKWGRFGYIDEPLVVLRISRDSLHRVDQPRGETAMLGLLVRERDALAGDSQALAAVRRGLRERVKQFAWYYEDRGQRTTAIGIYLRGFRLMRDPELLVRAAAVWLPQAARDRLGRAWKTRARAGARRARWSSRVGASPRRSIR